jgi:hypothetical protein
VVVVSPVFVPRGTGEAHGGNEHVVPAGVERPDGGDTGAGCRCVAAEGAALHLRAINEADDEEDFMTGGENGGAGSGPDVRGGTQEERGAIERTPRPAPTVNAVAKRAPHRPVLRLKGY